MCKCGKLSRPKQQNCWNCHASNMRVWRITHRLHGEAKIKDGARHYANVYEKRGTLKREGCEIVGCVKRAQKHHEDYTKPLQVRWLCREHHLQLHNMEIRKKEQI